MENNENKKIHYDIFLKFFRENINIFLISLLTSYIITSSVNIMANKNTADSLNFITSLSGIKTMIIFVILSVVLFLLKFIDNVGKKIIYTILLISVFLFAILTICDNKENFYIAVGVSAIVSFFIYYILNKGILFKNRLINNYIISFVVIFAAFIFMSFYMGLNTVNRYRIFAASNFDFGIFAQLFENMAKSGSTVISVERNEMMSHFYNHFSPIYYVLLPLYMPFRRPEALLIIQAVFVLGSVFPLCLIGKKSGLSPLLVMLLGLVLLFSPGLNTPLFYDFHENKFLPFFMLWFIYFFSEKKYIPAYIFMILTLMIKEDAVIYVAFTLIYFMLIKKNIKFGIIGLVISIIYSVPVMFFMRTYGLDFVGWRYGVYFLDGQNKIMQMFVNIIMNPAFFLKNVFSEECLKFIIYMMGPLLFMPVVTKDFRRLVILIPFVAINIMTDYPYQHDIGFQYTYGSLALMMFMFIENIKDFSEKNKTIIVSASVMVSILFLLSLCSWRFGYYNKNYKENMSYYKTTEEMLDKIPDDVSITCNTFILPHLYDHKELYMKDDNYRRTDYYVLDSNNQDEINEFESNPDYSEYIKCNYDGKAIIYKLPEAPEMSE